MWLRQLCVIGDDPSAALLSRILAKLFWTHEGVDKHQVGAAQ